MLPEKSLILRLLHTRNVGRSGIRCQLAHCRFTTLNPQQVQARLTLFPKYFASFPHGTSVLLISRVYCTLNEVYHQIGAYVSESATHIAYAVRIPRKDRTELSPSIHPNTKGDGSEGMLTNCYTKL